jgi:hypothetical protein
MAFKSRPVHFGMEIKLDIFIYSDQPTTCPNCGDRTNILFDMSHTKEMTQIHECLATDCKFIFVVQKE